MSRAPWQFQNTEVFAFLADGKILNIFFAAGPVCYHSTDWRFVSGQVTSSGLISCQGADRALTW
jgi:hypothetical protein